MKIKKVTVGIQLYSIPITYTFLAYVETTSEKKTYFPIGRQVIYVIGSETYITYADLPILVYRQHQNIEVLDDQKFNNLMMLIVEQMNKQLSIINFPTYKSDGVQIQYVYQEPIIHPDSRISTLVYGMVAKQDQIRPLIDITDQLFNHNPTSHVTITFYTKSGSMFYIAQFITKMEYAYDNKYLYFFNKDVGYIKYRIINGDIEFELNPIFRKKIIDQFKLNYPNANLSDVKLYILALQPNVNNASILYNN